MFICYSLFSDEVTGEVILKNDSGR